MSVLPMVAGAAAVGKVAPLLPPGPLRHTAEAVGNPVAKGVSTVIDAGHQAARTASSAGREGGRLLSPASVPTSLSGFAGSRLVVAVLAGVIALEVISQLTGRYFQWSPAVGARNAKGAAQYLGLYPGQLQQLPDAGGPAASTAPLPGTDGGTAAAGPKPGTPLFGQLFPDQAGLSRFTVVPNPAALTPAAPARNPLERTA